MARGRTMTAQQYWQAWQNGMNNAGPKITAGVQAMQVAPGVKAAQAVTKMRANFLAALDSGKYARNVQAVTLQQFQQAMIQKGIPRIADGVRGAQAKVTEFAGSLLPFIGQLQAQIEMMPNITDQDREQRMLAWVRGMKQYQPGMA